MPPPILRTARLTLRPFTLADAPVVRELAGAYEVALNTLVIPHPYPEGAAEEWIATHEGDFAENRTHHFAIDDAGLVGAIGLVIKGDRIGELGYWIGVPYWNRGYASEAAEAVVRYGFEQCNLHRIFACHYTRNAGSGRVMQKIGMRYEGTLRHHLKKWEEYVDLAFYGILREDWDRLKGGPA
jgi:RimJ/RimL family protein N-acetyltransferase